MGGSSWEYTVPFEVDVATTLAALHQQLFEREFADGWADLGELRQDEEFMGNIGTHTILDVHRIVDSSDAPDWRSGDDYNTLRPLAPERIRHHFGTERPSRREYEALRAAQQLPPFEPRTPQSPVTLDDECQMRWTGRYLLLYDGAEPTDVAFWGYSGD